MKRDYGENKLREIVSESKSIADVIRAYGMVVRGSSYDAICNYIKQYNIDTSHFTGQRWNKDASFLNYSARIPLEKVLIEGSKYSSDRLKKRLIAERFKEEKCECCGISDWMGKPLVLELHHKNGNHYDNRIENLQILCPNCHSQTDSYRKKNKNKKLNKEKAQLIPQKGDYNLICQFCGKEFKADRAERKYCSRDCYTKSLNKAKENNFSLNKEKLMELLKEHKTITSISEYTNISRTTIRKYLREYDLMDFLDTESQLHSKRVIQLDLDNNFIKEWPSVSDAEKTLNIFSIGKCAAHKQVSAGGFKWEFKEI